MDSTDAMQVIIPLLASFIALRACGIPLITYGTTFIIALLLGFYLPQFYDDYYGEYSFDGFNTCLLACACAYIVLLIAAVLNLPKPCRYTADLRHNATMYYVWTAAAGHILGSFGSKVALPAARYVYSSDDMIGTAGRDLTDTVFHQQHTIALITFLGSIVVFLASGAPDPWLQQTINTVQPVLSIVKAGLDTIAEPLKRIAECKVGALSPWARESPILKPISPLQIPTKSSDAAPKTKLNDRPKVSRPVPSNNHIFPSERPAATAVKTTPNIVPVKATARSQTTVKAVPPVQAIQSRQPAKQVSFRPLDDLIRRMNALKIRSGSIVSGRRLRSRMRKQLPGDTLDATILCLRDLEPAEAPAPDVEHSPAPTAEPVGSVSPANFMNTGAGVGIANANAGVLGAMSPGPELQRDAGISPAVPTDTGAGVEIADLTTAISVPQLPAREAQLPAGVSPEDNVVGDRPEAVTLAAPVPQDSTGDSFKRPKARSTVEGKAAWEFAAWERNNPDRVHQARKRGADEDKEEDAAEETSKKDEASKKIAADHDDKVGNSAEKDDEVPFHFSTPDLSQKERLNALGKGIDGICHQVLEWKNMPFEDFVALGADSREFYCFLHEIETLFKSMDEDILTPKALPTGVKLHGQDFLLKCLDMVDWAWYALRTLERKLVKEKEGAVERQSEIVKLQNLLGRNEGPNWPMSRRTQGRTLCKQLKAVRTNWQMHESRPAFEHQYTSYVFAFKVPIKGR